MKKGGEGGGCLRERFIKKSLQIFIDILLIICLKVACSIEGIFNSDLMYRKTRLKVTCYFATFQVVFSFKKTSLPNSHANFQEKS